MDSRAYFPLKPMVRLAPASLEQVLVLSIRPFLARCAEALQQRGDLPGWRHGHCPICGWEPDFAVITPHGEIDRQYVDYSKLRALTGWEPEIGLEEGLRRTIEWQRAQLPSVV